MVFDLVEVKHKKHKMGKELLQVPSTSLSEFKSSGVQKLGVLSEGRRISLSAVICVYLAIPGVGI